MDYSSFFSQQYPNLTTANLQAATTSTFSLNQNPPTNVTHQQQRQQQQLPSNTVSQLQQNMFYLDPFNTKLEHPLPNDLDHASYSNESEVFLDELDDLSRNANAAQTRRNHSPQNRQNGNIPRLSQVTDFDITDLNQDFLDSSTGGNTNKRKAQNRVAQRAFRERKERHVKDLEAKVAALEEVTSKMADENTRLKSRVAQLEAENSTLKGSNITFTFPPFAKQPGSYSPPLSDRGSFDAQPPQQPTDIPMYDLDELNPNSATIKAVSPISLSDASAKVDSSIHSPNTPVSARVQNIMMQYQDFTQHNPKVVPPVSPEDGHNYFDCPKVWERIVTHPRFDEVDDVEALCSQLNSKVRICVEKGGPSVDSRELEAALDQAIEDSVATRS